MHAARCPKCPVRPVYNDERHAFGISAGSRTTGMVLGHNELPFSVILVGPVV